VLGREAQSERDESRPGVTMTSAATPRNAMALAHGGRDPV
jgi:hypothetical protein